MIHSINAEHRDLIHDVAFDHYGKRMATCSSDQFVKVWDNESYSNEWKLTASWKAHSGSVWKVTWAHPEFGQVLATCSFDRTVAVWEEIVSDINNPGISGARNWARRTNLVDSRTSVTDVKFAPKSLGLMLATCSVDGVIRIYEAPDVMNLSQWTLQHEVGKKLQCSCICWNPAYSRERLLNYKIKIPPNNERKDLGCSPEDFDRSALKYVLPLEKTDSYIVIPQVPMLAVGSDDVTVGSSSKAMILQYNENSRRWSKLDNFSGVNEPVHDIAFAPRLGRSFDILAVATKDVKIFVLTQIMDVVGALRYEIHLAASCEDHKSSVWRVSWNILGNILASSGDDGYVRFWKSGHRRKPTSQSDPHRTQSQASGKAVLAEEMDLDKSSSKIPYPSEFNLHTLGLQTAWTCVASMKGDERMMPSESAEVIGSPPPHNITTRYFKLASISHPNQVPWH